MEWIKTLTILSEIILSAVFDQITLNYVHAVSILVVDYKFKRFLTLIHTFNSFSSQLILYRFSIQI